MPTQITVFEGARCIGGSKIHLQIEDVGLFLDFGMNFGNYGKYFEEFVRPRAARGIHDLWVLNLIPHLEGIYRKDIFPGDFSGSSSSQVQVDAVFVSHAHLDHSGNIGLLKSSIPLYASGLTATIIKAIQDCGRPALESEVVYTAPREAKGDNERIIVSVRNAPCAARPTFIVDAAADILRLNEFWSNSFSTKKIECAGLEAGNPGSGPVNFRSFPVDHSIYGATAYAFETSAGWIVYSGDLRLHGRRGHLTKRFVEQISELKPAALVIEGTNIAEAMGTSEDEVHDNCLKATQAAGGKLVVADFGPRNIERLQIFLDIAKRVDRKLLVTAKDAFLLHAMHLADESVPDVLDEHNLGIFDEVKAQQNKWEKEFIRIEYAHKFVGAAEVAREPEKYILAFSFFDLKHLLDVMPSGGIYIYSTSEAFTEEMEIDVRRLKNWLDFFKMTPIGFNVNNQGELEFVKGYHASGHISGSELIEVIKNVNPKLLIPVHTEKPELFKEKLAGESIEVRLPEEAIPIEIEKTISD